MEHIPFIKEQNKFKPKINMFLNFRNNSIAYMNKFRKDRNKTNFYEQYFCT